MRYLAALLTLSAVALAGSAPPVIRPTPDFTVTEPSGKQIALSSLRGKVVVLTWMFTTCPHCQHESEMLTKILKDLGPRGLVVLGVAINDNAAILVPGFVEQYGVGFPVGVSNAAAMTSYMGFSQMMRWSVPQVVVIDKKGNIRAQSPFSGGPNLQTESYMRDLLDTLLKEPGRPPVRKTSHR